MPPLLHEKLDAVFGFKRRHLNVGCVMFNSLAAALNPPALATAWKERSDV